MNTLQHSRLTLVYLMLVFASTVLSTHASAQSEAETDSVLSPIAQFNLTVTEPSGLALGEGHLWTVSDKANRVYKISFTGETLDSLIFTGNDLEGIASNPQNGSLWIVEERSRTVVQLDPAGREIKRAVIPIERKKANRGLEGITFNSADRYLYAVNEKSPKRLLKIDLDLRFIAEHKLTFAKDYSGIAYDENSHTFWVVSHQSKTLSQCDMMGNLIRQFSLDIKKAEGVAVDVTNKRIYIVSDSQEMLYTFDLPQ